MHGLLHRKWLRMLSLLMEALLPQQHLAHKGAFPGTKNRKNQEGTSANKLKKGELQ